MSSSLGTLLFQTNVLNVSPLTLINMAREERTAKATSQFRARRCDVWRLHIQTASSLRSLLLLLLAVGKNQRPEVDSIFVQTACGKQNKVSCENMLLLKPLEPASDYGKATTSLPLLLHVHGC